MKMSNNPARFKRLYVKAVNRTGRKGLLLRLLAGQEGEPFEQMHVLLVLQ